MQTRDRSVGGLEAAAPIPPDFRRGLQRAVGLMFSGGKIRGGGMGVAPKSANSDDTFGKLMRVNAWVRGERPAFRLKEYGVWRTWTWGQAYQETRALAQGLLELGINPGDRIAIAGVNRPKLYWAITAAQMLSAIPVPLYAD